MLRVTLATNGDNLRTTDKRPSSVVKELAAFITKLEVKDTLKKEKDTVSMSMISLDLKLLCSGEIVVKPYPVRYVAPQFQTFDNRRLNTHEHIVQFLDFVGAHCSVQA